MAYISKKCLFTRLRRYKALNHSRLQQALSVMSSDDRSCLSVVPLLLHYNHVNLVGYCGDDVPCGIDLFSPDSYQTDYLRKVISSPELPSEPKEHAVLGLYAMGSTSSLGQGAGSDLDLWVCTKPGLSAERLDALQAKCRIISKYAKSRSVELNLFVTPVDRFSDFRPDCMDEENCGSAQNILLLDEFYRTSIRLCGRYIIWYLISSEEEKEDYAGYVDFLIHGKGNNRIRQIKDIADFVSLTGNVSEETEDKLSFEQSISYDADNMSALLDLQFSGIKPLYSSSLKFVSANVKYHDPHAEHLSVRRRYYSRRVGFSISVFFIGVYGDNNFYTLSSDAFGKSSVIHPLSVRFIKEDEKLCSIESIALSSVEDWGLHGEYAFIAYSGFIPASDLSAYADGNVFSPVSVHFSDQGFEISLYGTDYSGPGSALFLISDEDENHHDAYGQNTEEELSDTDAKEEKPYAIFKDAAMSIGRELSLKNIRYLMQRNRYYRQYFSLYKSEEYKELHMSLSDPEALKVWSSGFGNRLMALSENDMYSMLKLPVALGYDSIFVSDSLSSLTENKKSIQKLNRCVIGLEAVSSSGNSADYPIGKDRSASQDNVMRIGSIGRLAEAMGVSHMPLADILFNPESEGMPVHISGDIIDPDAANAAVERNESALFAAECHADDGAAVEKKSVENIVASYEEPAEQNIRPFLKAEEWFDFGSVSKNSPAEFFGSGLWLLYKAIDSPFKVVLKILLMESYSSDYPNTVLLASELKDFMLSHDGYSLDLDAYYLMYRRVSDYLIRKNDDRLNLMRKCFYLKIFKGIHGKDCYSKSDMRMKRELLNRFAERWKWDKDSVESIEHLGSWRLNEVRSFYKDVHSTLFGSYLSLLKFSVRHGIEYAITSDDVGILSRKLYAAFDLYPGKIPVLNLSFRHSLEERKLTFIKPSENSLCRKGWHLYAAAPYEPKILNSSVFYIGRRLCEVVAWACFNGILGTETECFTAGSGSYISGVNIRRLGRDLMRMLCPHLGGVKESSLQKARELKACLVILNFENDPVLSLGERRSSETESTLCYGRQRLCLVGSIDLVMINSWGEVTSVSMPDGEEGVVELLATLLRIAGNSAEDRLSAEQDSQTGTLIPDSIRICCYADINNDLIRYDMEQTVRNVFSCISSSNSSEYMFEVGANTYVARSAGGRGVVINKRGVFGSEEFDSRVLSQYGMRPEYSLQVPAVVDRYATLGIVQYFFSPADPADRIWDIFIINERNEVSIRRNYRGSRAELVNAINRFYTGDGTVNRKVRFNLPQYFVLNEDQTALHPFTIHGA